LAASGSANGSYVAWQYLNGLTTPPTQGVSGATLTFNVPTDSGDYEFRLFANNGSSRLVTSGAVTVSPSPAQISVNGMLPPADVMVQPGATATVQVTGGPGNTTDWIALAASGSANGSYLAWQYLNGLTAPPTQGVSGATLTFSVPTVAGTYEFRLFANNGFSRLATSSNVIATTGSGDTTPPTVTSVSPTSGATGVSLASNITATFSEELAAGSVTTSTFELRDSSDTLVPASVTYQSTTHRAVLVPTDPLYEVSGYTAILKTGITNTTGIHLPDEYSWAFTTADITAPTVSQTLPAPGTSDADPAAALAVVFSEPMADATITSSAFELRDSANTVVPLTVTYDAEASTATLVPAAQLAYSATYTGTVKGGSSSGATDLAGNALDADYRWSFSTQSAPCSYAVSPTSISAPSGGTSGRIDVSTSWGCQASLASDAPWLSATPIGYSARILGDHPAGYWRLDDPVHASAQDFSGHALAGWYSDTAIHRVPTPWADGNRAAAFDGTGYIDLSSDASLDSQTSFSLEAWVRVTQPTALRCEQLLAGFRLCPRRERDARGVPRGQRQCVAVLRPERECIG
jgi:hypothetical protein